MAKEKKDDKAKIRVFFGEIEGDNQTVRDALRSITDAVTRTFQPDVRIVKVITTDGSVDQGRLLTEAEDQEIIDMGLQEARNENLDDKDNEPDDKKPSKPRTFSIPEMLDLDLKSGEISFESFSSQKNPKTQLGKYLVIAYWLKNYRGIEAIGVQHVYTIFKFMKWATPKDIDSVLRSTVKSGAGGEFKRRGKKEYELTIAGANVVDKMNS